jgi:hypothetical protein
MRPRPTFREENFSLHQSKMKLIADQFILSKASKTKRTNCDETLVERFDLDNRCAVIAADPKRAGVLGIVDIDAADVGWARQHVFRILAALDIKTRHAVG